MRKQYGAKITNMKIAKNATPEIVKICQNALSGRIAENFATKNELSQPGAPPRTSGPPWSRAPALRAGRGPAGSGAGAPARAAAAAAAHLLSGLKMRMPVEVEITKNKFNNPYSL